MAQQSLNQARVVDPVLTTVARGYRSPRAGVADVLFPIVEVAKRAGYILAFGKDDFKLVSTIRAPGSNTKRVQYGYASERFSLVDHRLEGGVPSEISEESPGIDMGANAVRRVQNTMALERENQAAALATNPANYDASNKEPLSGTSQWSNPSSDPQEDILDAKEVVRSQIGEEPNVLTIGPKGLRYLRNHPKILDKLSTATDRTPATLAQLAALFELEQIVVGKSVRDDGTKFVDVWGNSAVLAYTTPASEQEMGSPNFGYTYRLEDRPVVEEPYYDHNAVTWYYPVSDAYMPVLTGKAAGFLFTNVVQL